MKRPGYRATVEPRNDRGPTQLLLAGLGLALIGACTAILTWTGAVSQMRAGDDPSPILDVIGLVSALAIPVGAVLIVISLGWWLFRVGRAAGN